MLKSNLCSDFPDSLQFILSISVLPFAISYYMYPEF